MERLNIRAPQRFVRSNQPPLGAPQQAPYGRTRAGNPINPDEHVLIPPEPYLQAVRKTLRIIDLDPCSTERAQRTIDALAWYRATDAPAALAEPWTGKVFLHPHWNQNTARFQIQKLIRDYLADRVQAAIVLSPRMEWLRTEPLLLSFPFLIHYKRLPQWRWSEKEQKLERINPSFSSFTLYLPQRDGRHFDDERLAAFIDAFAPYGRAILSEDFGEGWQQQAILATRRMSIKPVLTETKLDRYSELPDHLGAPPHQPDEEEDDA